MFNDIFTHSRASTATYVDLVSGLVTEAAVDQARFDKNGLLIERTATNLLANSEYNDDVYTPSSNVTTAQTMNFRSGITSNAVLLDGVASGYAYRSYTGSVSSVYCLSFFVEMLDGGAAPSFPGTSIDSGRSFNLVHAGEVKSDPIIVTHIKDNIYRVSQVATCTSTNGSYGVNKYLSNDDRPVKVSGFQLELNRVTSYIPTTTASATRSSEAVSLANLDSYNTAEGTFYIEMLLDDNFYSSSACVGQTSPTRRIIAFDSGAGNRFLVTNGSGTTVQYTKDLPEYSVAKFAASIDSNNNVIACVDGITNTGTLTGTQVTDLTTFSFSGSGACSIKDFKYWPYPKTAAELEALTA